MASEMNFNLNDHVKVRITKEGRRILNHLRLTKTANPMMKTKTLEAVEVAAAAVRSPRCIRSFRGCLTRYRWLRLARNRSGPSKSVQCGCKRPPRFSD